MGVPDYQSLMRPLLRALSERTAPINVRELVPEIASELNLTDDDCAVRTPNGTDNLLYYRMRWARTYMSKAGLVTSLKRGATVITERGREALKRCPSRVDNDYLKQYPEFVTWVTGSSAAGEVKPPVGGHIDEAPAETPLERIGGAQRELDAALRSELLDRVREMTPSDFENLIVRLLLAMGYGQGAAEMATAIGGTGDGGMDGVIHQDPLGLERVYIQAKRWKEGNNVSSPEIRNFIGALNIHRANKGVFVTASQFTPDAQAAARGSTVQVVMIDGEKLAELMLRYKVGVLVRSTIEIKELDEGFFDA